jgi:hypothetical protein
MHQQNDYLHCVQVQQQQQRRQRHSDLNRLRIFLFVTELFQKYLSCSDGSQVARLQFQTMAQG